MAAKARSTKQERARCVVCNHASVRTINQGLAAGKSPDRAAEIYRLPLAAVKVHARRHLPPWLLHRDQPYEEGEQEGATPRG